MGQLIGTAVGNISVYEPDNELDGFSLVAFPAIRVSFKNHGARKAVYICSLQTKVPYVEHDLKYVEHRSDCGFEARVTPFCGSS